MASSTPCLFQAQILKMVPRLRAFAVSLCRDQSRADDLVQETFAKAWKYQSRFVTGSNLKAWLFTILRNTFISELRKRKGEIDDPDGALVSNACCKAAQDGYVDLADLTTSLGELPTEQRAALILVGAEGDSYA